MILFRTPLIILLLTSCGAGFEKEKLIGQYAWSDGRMDTLEIRADGTYEYWYFKPGRKIAHSGTWKFNSTLNEIEFEKENFPFLTNHAPGGIWFARLQVKNAEVRLLQAADPAYLKQTRAVGK